LVCHIEEGTEAVGESNGARQDCTVRSFVIGAAHQILFAWSSQGGWDGWDMWHILQERGGVYRVLVGKP